MMTESGRQRGDRAEQPDTISGKVLVVDDEEAIVEILCLLLADAGYMVSGATDGPEALQVIRHQHPAVVITDIMMPVMSGFEVARAAARIDPDVRVLLMSAFTEAIGEGGFPVVAKPFDLQEVVELVDAQLHAA